MDGDGDGDAHAMEVDSHSTVVASVVAEMPQHSVEQQIVEQNNNELAMIALQQAEAGGGGGGGRSYGQVLAQTFEEKRAELVAMYSTEQALARNPTLARELGACTTANEVWATLNQRDTRGADEEEFEHVRSIGEAMEESGMAERLRQEAQEKYTIVDPQTGEQVLANLNNPAHMEALREKLNVFVRKQHTPQHERAMHNAASYNLRHADLPADRDGKRSAVTMPTLTPKQAEKYKRSGKLPEKYKAKREKVQELQVAMVSQSLREFNAIVTAPAEEAQIVQLRADRVDFSATATRFFPLTLGVLSEAQIKYGRETRSSLSLWNTVPLPLFESKLRLIMFGQKTFRTTSSYHYHAWVHAMFLWALSTDLRPNHADFLAQEENNCRQLNEAAHKERADLLAQRDTLDAARFAQREQQVQQTLNDVAFFARSIALAKKAWLERNEVVSPFNEYLTREGDARWKPMNVPRHSKEEIAHIVETLHEQERMRYPHELAKLEEAFRSGHLDTRAFLKEFYDLTHITTVNTCKAYDVGLLLLYEIAIPSSYRADYSLRPHHVPNKPGIVRPEVASVIDKERDFFRTVRRHYHTQARELLEQQGKSEQIKCNGVTLDRAAVAMHECIDEGIAMSPTFGDMLELYEMVTADYGCIENAVVLLDEMDKAYRNIYDGEGKLINDYQRILDGIDMQNSAGLSDAAQSGKKSRTQ